MMHVLEHSRSRARSLVDNPLSSNTKVALVGAGALVVVGGLIYAATRPAAAATPAQKAAAAAQASITLSMQDGTTVGVGQQHPVTAQLVLGDGTTTDITTQVTWSSSDPSVLAIQGQAPDASGAVATPVSPGTAALTAVYTRPDGSTVMSGPVHVSVIAAAPSGTPAPPITTIIDDATLIRTAQQLLLDVVNARAPGGGPLLVPSDGSTIYFTAANVTGTSSTPNDHAFVTALAQVQAIVKSNDPAQLSGMATNGQLDYLTLAALVILAGLTGSTIFQWLEAGSVSDPTMILVAQGALAHLIAVGQVAAQYTAAQVDGSLGGAAFQKALAAFQRQWGAKINAALVANGKLDWLSWAALVSASAAY